MSKVTIPNSKQTRYSRVAKMLGLLLLIVFTFRSIIQVSLQKCCANITSETKSVADTGEDKSNNFPESQPEFMVTAHYIQIAPVFSNIETASFTSQNCCLHKQHYMPVLTPPPNC